MDIKEWKKQIAEDVVEPMLEFIDEEPDGYTKAEVKACKSLLENYLMALKGLKAPTDAAIMACVKDVVLALNELNDQTDGSLIETGEREAIWEIIQGAAVACGLSEEPDDVTEEWREW